MEIARRRQQIDENACLHEELSRLAKLRENVEISDRLNVPISSNLASNVGGVIGGAYGANPSIGGMNQFGTPMSPAVMAAAAAASGQHTSASNFNQLHTNNPHYLNPSSQLSHTAIHPGSIHAGTGAAGSHLIPTSGVDGTSVLKSVDEILRETGGTTAMTGGLPTANTLLTNHHHVNPSAYSNLTNNLSTTSRTNTFSHHQNTPYHVTTNTSLHNHIPTGGIDHFTGAGVGVTPTISGQVHHHPTSSYDHRVTDFSPINSEINDNLNPMLNDMTITGNRSSRFPQRAGTFGQQSVGF